MTWADYNKYQKIIVSEKKKKPKSIVLNAVLD